MIHSPSYHPLSIFNHGQSVVKGRTHAVNGSLTLRVTLYSMISVTVGTSSTVKGRRMTCDQSRHRANSEVE
jgi:hypothetical protein